MSPPNAVLPPTSSLPRLRPSSPTEITHEEIASALHGLTALYCPLPRAAALSKPCLPPSNSNTSAIEFFSAHSSVTTASSTGTSTPREALDSGYASGEEEEDGFSSVSPHGEHEQHASALRADPFERAFATRWLTSFLARAEDLLPGPDTDDDARQLLVDEAASILASFSAASDENDDDDKEEGEDVGAIVREFCFPTAAPAPAFPQDPSPPAEDAQPVPHAIDVRLTDHVPSAGADHTDVGLQSWGASIVVSGLLCAHPSRFGLSASELGGKDRRPRVVELGAGTGLVAITLAKLLPRLGVAGAEVLATDYHPAVMANLRANVAANFPGAGRREDEEEVVRTCLLDWSALPVVDDDNNPILPLDRPADMLIATDVVYAPEHAVWLRDCAGRMLARRGVFWLVASVRPGGRFQGVTNTVEAAFADRAACPRTKDGEGLLAILGWETLEKQKGVGRGDEVGYKMFRIGWAVESEGKMS